VELEEAARDRSKYTAKEVLGIEDDESSEDEDFLAHDEEDVPEEFDEDYGKSDSEEGNEDGEKKRIVKIKKNEKETLQNPSM